MRAALILGTVFGPLAVFALNLERGLEGGAQDGPAAPTTDSFSDGTALYEQWPQLGSVPVNRTMGSPRSGKHQPNSLLQGRQTDVSAIFQSVPAPLTSSPTFGCRLAWIQVIFSCVLLRIRFHAATQNSQFVRFFNSSQGYKPKRSPLTGCHTSTCCPTGTFCVGQLSCCQLGTVACNEGSSSNNIIAPR